MKNYYIKTNRTFNLVRKYSWLITVIIAIGGLWQPKLGLVVLVIMASLFSTAFFNGRYWCGNVCPHGSLFDRIFHPISRNARLPKTIRTKVFIGLFFLFFVGNMGRKVFKVLSLWGTYQFLDKLGLVFVMTYMVVMVLGGLLAIFLTPRTWCQFCPMGSIQKISHKLGKGLRIAPKVEKKLTISAREKCHNCGKCARVCPFQLEPYLEFSDNNQFDNPNCIKCNTCVNNCPAGILSRENKREALKLKEAPVEYGYQNIEEISGIVENIKVISDEINQYEIRFKSPEKVQIESGQFILVKIQDKPTQYRAYSISTIDKDQGGLSIMVRKVKKGYGTGKIFENFKVGDSIELKGPMGNELVMDQDATKVLFISNGIGITPFIALAEEAALNRPNISEARLLTGQKKMTDLIYHDYFMGLESEDKFKYYPVVSRDKESGLKTGYVTDSIKEMEDLSDYRVYMCGSKNMIVDSYNILLEKGVKKEHIFYEGEEKITLN